MSAQSIYRQDIHSLRKSINQDILEQARQYTLHNRFMLGECIDTKKRNHALMYSEFICTTNCELIEFINKTQLGEDIEIKEPKINLVCPPSSGSETIYIYVNGDEDDNNSGGSGSGDCSDCMIWENKTW